MRVSGSEGESEEESKSKSDSEMGYLGDSRISPQRPLGVLPGVFVGYMFGREIGQEGEESGTG